MEDENQIIDDLHPIIQNNDQTDVDFSRCNSFICDPKKNFFRYFGLIFMCMLGFGSYFCGDIPAALQDNFKNDLKISTTTFTEFYAWGSWPNVILCFFGC